MTPAEALAALDRWAAILRIPDLQAAAVVLREAVERLPEAHDECPWWPKEESR